MATSIEAESEIDAPIERVSAILFDLDCYHEWNPFTPRIDTSLQEGDPVLLHVAMRPGKKILQKETVLHVEPGHKLCWGMKILTPALLQAHRCQILTDLGNGRTRYFTSDRFEGILTPLVMWMYREHVQRGFQAVANALKTRAESEPANPASK